MPALLRLRTASRRRAPRPRARSLRSLLTSAATREDGKRPDRQISIKSRHAIDSAYAASENRRHRVTTRDHDPNTNGCRPAFVSLCCCTCEPQAPWLTRGSFLRKSGVGIPLSEASLL